MPMIIALSYGFSWCNELMPLYFFIIVIIIIVSFSDYADMLSLLLRYLIWVRKSLSRASSFANCTFKSV